MGAATAWRLAQRGHEVTVLERTVPATVDGSSHGSARIFRYAYPDAFYARLVVKSRAGFAELEQLSGQALISVTGALDFGALRDPRQLADVLTSVGVQHEILSRAEVTSRLPGIVADTAALWHPDAGVLDPLTTVNVMVGQLAAHGGQMLTQWPVQRVERRARGFRVISKHGETLDAERVVVAAGGWVPDLMWQLPLPSSFTTAMPTITVTQENAYHFPYRDQAEPHPSEASWPTFIHKTDAIQTYSLPGGRDAGFRGQKLAEFGAGRVMSSAAQQDGRIDPGNRERMIAYVQERLPGLEPRPYAMTTCLFSSTPTQDFVVDTADGITVVSACSGHGGKFAPLIGTMVADEVTGENPAAVPDRFRLGGH